MKKIILIIAILTKTAIASTLSSDLSMQNVRIANKKVTHLANRKFDRQLFIRSNGRITNILSHISKEYYTDDYLQEILSQKNKIAAVNITTYGILSQSNGKQNHHEVTSCVFINIETGCIISRESATACSGKWIGDEMWETDQGEKTDIAALKNSILSKTTADTDLLKNENFDLCKKSQFEFKNIK